MKFKDKYGDYTGKTWDGYLDCSDLGLTSLEGAPKVVKGDFYCFNNNLTSLEYAPEVVKGGFSCSNNPKLFELTEDKLKKIVKAKVYLFDYIPMPLTMYLKRLRRKYVNKQ